jgi:hypothetical protein
MPFNTHSKIMISPEMPAPEDRAFVLDKLTDDQIVWLYRSLFRLCSDLSDANPGVRHTLDLGDGVMVEFARLVQDDPQRGEPLLTHLADSDDEADVSLAAYACPYIARTHYELARDVLLKRIGKRYETESLPGAGSDAYVGACSNFSEFVMPEQAVDFRAQEEAVYQAKEANWS